MIKKIVLSLFFLLLPISTWAHDVPDELIEYVLENPGADWDQIQNFVKQKNWKEVEEKPLETALQLPGTEEITNVLFENPDLPLAYIETLKNESPLLARFEATEIQQVVQNYWKEQAQNQAKADKPFSLQGFIYLGIIHIVGGLDHILFVLALILLLPKTKRLIALLTTFTIAHSSTFLLAGTETLSVSNHITEPLIALSIVLTAIWALKKPIGSAQKASIEVAVIFFFGLFHGLGFAGVFEAYTPEKSELLLGVLGFNIGIEIGQIAIVALAYPILYFAYQTKYKTLLKNSTSILLIVLGTIWFIERIYLAL